MRIGHFPVLGLIGRGGMGVVYACYDDILDRKVAVNLLRGEITRDGAAALMRREAQALAKLSHPNVVAVHDVGALGERVYLAMEFVDGQTLGSWLKASRRGWREVLQAILAAGDSLAAAHAKGVIHRDIKPDNIMVGADGRVRVMDFGLVHAAAAAAQDRLRAQPRGRPRRAAAPGRHAHPHRRARGHARVRGQRAVLGQPTDARTDQFSLCATAWEALYGDNRRTPATPCCRWPAASPAAR